MDEGEGLDTNNSSYHYVGLTADIKSGSSKSFSIQTEEEKIAEIAVFNLDGTYYAKSNSCIHKGGPLSKGFLNGDIVTCPWHGWKYSVKTGKSPHKDGDSVNSYQVKIIKDKIYVSSIPTIIGKRIFQPHEAYLKLKESVDDYLNHKSNDRVLPVDDKKIRVLGISTTNANDEIAPRQSRS
jgi:nitrite reductase/ring-hydroxylating ferredoxin subunit